MKRVSWLLILYVLISYSSELGEGFTQWIQDVSSAVKRPHRRSKRSLFEFEDVITCLQPWVDVITTYADYGCYCGYKGHGQPLDDTDKCCYYHDRCYTEAETKSSASAFSSYFSSYEFECVNNSKIVCNKERNSDYAHSYCECDRLASECFLQARRSYTKKLFNINTGKYCAEKPDLSDLKIPKHTLDKLYSCKMRMHEDKCCSTVGYNSEYQICCHGKVKTKEEGCKSHGDL